MTVALAAGLVVSCSDELNLEQKAALHVEEGDLVGSLYSESPTRVAMLDEFGSQGYPAVWSEDDEVNVFSPIRLNYNHYVLKEGQGTQKAVFEPLENDPTLLEANDLYAITNALCQYGVSKINAGADDKDVLLTATIPCSFDWEKVAASVDAYKMPAPWWGPATFGDGGELNVAFRPLTAVMRIDLADLPEHVNSIVLVSGNNTAVGAKYYVNGDEYSGTGEGLSGTFNAVLSLGNAAESALASDSRLICYDTLRVDLPEVTEEGEDKVLFLPLIAQHYDNLKVIAVMDDDVMPYSWNGEILRTYTDLYLENGETLNLSQVAEKEILLDSPLEISKEIASMYDGKHQLVVSLPNIDFSDPSDNTLYIINNKKSQVGQTSISINFPDDLDDDVINIAEIEAIFTGDVPNTGAQFLRFKSNSAVVEDFDGGDLDQTSINYEPEVKSQDKERTVRLNFTHQGDGIINITLPTSNVEMTSAQDPGIVNIITANTENVSGYDFDQTYNAVSNEQNAGLKFTGVYSVVNYAGTGAVYFFEENSEITEELNIFGKEPRSLRITDALINTISYPTLGTGTNSNYSSAAAPTSYIFTTGSAAIKELNEPGDKVKIKAFWTSRRLTPYAVNNGYEGVEVTDPSYNIETGAIYTAAQLQGLGLSELIYNYTISPKVESIWLGGVTFPWVGAEIEQLDEVQPTVSVPQGQSSGDATPTSWAYKVGNGEKVSEKVSLDGRNVTLKNMILDIYDPNIVLPGCCGTTQKVRLLQNLGLIRSIRTKETVDLFNIQLDDVLLDTHQFKIDNIGSLVGIIQAEKDVRIGGKELGATVSNFTDIRIASKGNNIGGIVGELETLGAPVIIDNVRVESIEKNNHYIHGGHIQGKNNVGGIAGRVTYDGAYDHPQPESALENQGDVEDVYTTTYNVFRVNRLFIPKDGYLLTGPADAHGYSYKEGLTKETAARYSDGMYYIDGTGSAVRYYSSDNDNKPKTGTKLYWNEACTDEFGTFSGGYGADTYEFYYDGYKNKISDITKQQLYKYTGSGDAPLTDVEIEDNEADAGEYSMQTGLFEEASMPYNWRTSFYYVIVEDTQSHDQNVSGGSYPTALNISNALVNFELKTDGIILGEQGDNVGGMVGFAVINGPTNIWNTITVKVPTIKATTKETRSLMKNSMPEFGNSVGGVIGTYFNVNDNDEPITQSKFAGTIKSSKGIFAESGHAGGVIGLQKTVKFVPTTDHSDIMQVLFGVNGKALNVEVGELKAENGWAGGLVGYESMGKVGIATEGNSPVSFKATEKVSGANCLGGLIGEQNDMAKIGSGSGVTVDIKDFEITKPLSYFSSNADRMYLGTVGTLVGQKNQWLYVNGSNVIITLDKAIADKDNKNLLSDAKKKALLFKNHASAATTEQVQSDKFFWGDENGYVGFAKESSMYFVKNAQQGNYEFNIYKAY